MNPNGLHRSSDLAGSNRITATKDSAPIAKLETTSIKIDFELASLHFSEPARRLYTTVKELCSYDRRFFNKEGHEETLHYLLQKLEGLGLNAEIFPENKLLGDLVIGKAKMELQTFIESLSEEYTRATEHKRKKQRLSELTIQSPATISNIRTQIGDPNGRKIILGAHYDIDWAITKGAGADDNASGVAVVIELANRMKKYKKAFEEAGICLEFALFDAEETPVSLAGSHEYYHGLNLIERCDAQLMMNFDMLGYYDAKQEQKLDADEVLTGDEDPVKIVFDRLANKFPKKEDYLIVESNQRYNALYENILAGILDEQGVKTAELNPQDLQYFDRDDKLKYHSFGLYSYSDHVSFNSLMPTLYLNDNHRSNPNLHDDDDTPDTLNYEKMAQIVDGVEKYLLTFVDK